MLREMRSQDNPSKLRALMAETYLEVYFNYPRDDITDYLQVTSESFINNIVFILDEFSYE